MTKQCIQIVDKFEEDNEVFEGLSVEQLLYSAIKGSDIEDVRYVLENTKWDEWI